MVRKKSVIAIKQEKRWYDLTKNDQHGSFLCLGLKVKCLPGLFLIHLNLYLFIFYIKPVQSTDSPSGKEAWERFEKDEREKERVEEVQGNYRGNWGVLTSLASFS